MKTSVEELERLAYTRGCTTLAELLREIVDATPWAARRIETAEIEVDVEALFKEIKS